jgi:hypothetical protein
MLLALQETQTVGVAELKIQGLSALWASRRDCIDNTGISYCMIRIRGPLPRHSSPLSPSFSSQTIPGDFVSGIVVGKLGRTPSRLVCLELIDPQMIPK